MEWRPARSLVTLRNQLDSAYPGWTFLGYLGDQAHAAEASDHNPNAYGVVCALDIGPGGGLDIFQLADAIAANPHPDLKYIISNRRIAEWQNGFKWRIYDGSDPHDTHTHISVGRGPDGQSIQPYDDTINWNIGEDMSAVEILESALNKAKTDAATYQSAMNAAREADRIHESALNAANERIKQLEKGVTKQAVLDYVNKNLG